MRFIVDGYGGYRAYLNHVRSRCALMLGAYRALEHIEWADVRRLVFVCHGNVCRSPYAEARARLRGHSTNSFGLVTTGGVAANAAAQRIAKLRGVDLDAHRSTAFDPGRVTGGDLLIAFEPMHILKLRALMQPGVAQLTLLGLWEPGFRRPVIADPYGRSDEFFTACFDHIDAALETVSRLAGNP